MAETDLSGAAGLVSRPGMLRRPPRRWAALPCLGLVLLLAAGCAPRTATQLTALCDGRNVAQRLTLVVDSVAEAATPSVQQMLGRRSHIVLTLMNEVGAATCGEQSGLATWSGQLPGPLEQASDPDRRLEWRVEGTDVVVQFNPMVMDHNLGMALPLRGGVGRWSLSGFAGELASGRVLRQEDDDAP
jgi:hypothetical protein